MPNGQQLGTRQILLLDDVAADDVGYWVPWRPNTKASIDVADSGAGMNATLSLLMSNARVMPANGFNITVGGSATTDDVVALTLTSPDFANGNISADYTVAPGDTTDTIAAGLAAAFKTAVSNMSKNVNVGFDANAAAGGIQVSVATNVITVIWSTPFFVAIPYAAAGGAKTETFVISQYDSGLGEAVPGGTFTATGAVEIDLAATWIKMTCSSYVAGDLSAIIQAGADIIIS